MLRIDESPLGGSLLLPVHDELLFQVPEGSEDDAVRAMVSLMETEIDTKSKLGVVPLAADGDVYGVSWGHGYDTPDVLKERF